MKKDLENQIGSINEDLKNIYLPLDAVLILLGKRTAFRIAPETLIPELKESEDERIRKWLIDYFKNVGNTWIHREISPEQILSYLEKQKDHFRIVTKMVEQKHAEWDELQSEFKNINEAFEDGKKEVVVHPEKYGLCKPAEWSEEDKSHLASIIGCIELCNTDMEDAASVLGYYDGDIKWLKSLRPSWKPSEEQMAALERCAEYLEESDNEDADILAGLCEHLKKLM